MRKGQGRPGVVWLVNGNEYINIGHIWGSLVHSYIYIYIYIICKNIYIYNIYIHNIYIYTHYLLLNHQSNADFTCKNLHSESGLAKER